MALVESERVGIECHAYYNTGTYDIPTWTEITRIQDLSVANAKTMADIKSRLSAYARKRGAFIEPSLSFGYLYKAGTDTVRDALLGSFVDGTVLDVLILDDVVTESGAAGFRLHVEVSKWDDDQAMENGKAVAVEAALAAEYDAAGALIEPDLEYAVP